MNLISYARILAILMVAVMPYAISAQTETPNYDPSQLSMMASAPIWFDAIQNNCTVADLNPWPIEIYGRIMFVDPDSRFLVANYQNKQKSFTEQNNLFIGYLGRENGVANTSEMMYGEMWTMVDVNYIADKSPYERNWIIAHESFHRVQNELGLPAANPDNSHLETRDGRILLQFELRALQNALTSKGDERINAIEDALLFRNNRYLLFPNAEVEECRYEMHEGMAEYTGAKLSGYNKELLLEVVAAKIKHADISKNLKWYFAYLTGPAYGLLLDCYYPEWIKGVSTETKLAQLLQSELEHDLPGSFENVLSEIIEKYEGKSIYDNEESRSLHQFKIRKQYIEKYENDTLLIIPLSDKMKMSFDPMSAIDLDDQGTIYQGKSHISDQWGALEANEDFFLSTDWDCVKLSKPILISAEVIEGDNWKLFLKEKWELKLVDGVYEIILPASAND